MINSMNATTFSGGIGRNTYDFVAPLLKVFSKVTEMKVCKLDYCENKHVGHGYCGAHLKQFNLKGYTQPLRKPVNEVILHNDYAEVFLYDINGYKKGTTKIDLDKVDTVLKHKWFFSAGCYVSSSISGKRILLHRFLVDTKEHIDHVNGDPSDNRMVNLRTATQSQNMMNKKIKEGVVRGVRYISNRYQARIKANNKRYYLGIYKTQEEAIAAREAGERILFGEYNRRKYNDDI